MMCFYASAHVPVHVHVEARGIFGVLFFQLPFLFFPFLLSQWTWSLLICRLPDQHFPGVFLFLPFQHWDYWCCQAYLLVLLVTYLLIYCFMLLLSGLWNELKTSLGNRHDPAQGENQLLPSLYGVRIPRLKNPWKRQELEEKPRVGGIVQQLNA